MNNDQETAGARRSRRIVFTFALLLATALAGPVSAVEVYSFDAFTANGIYYDSPLLDVTLQLEESEGSAAFTVTNYSSIASSISGIYIDDALGLLSSVTGIGNTETVQFQDASETASLPGSDMLSPAFESTFALTALNPAPSKGINQGESLEVSFELSPGAGSLAAAIAGGSLRIALKVVALPDESSESLLMGSEPLSGAAPEPATVLLLGIGALALIVPRR